MAYSIKPTNEWELKEEEADPLRLVLDLVEHLNLDIERMIDSEGNLIRYRFKPAS